MGKTKKFSITNNEQRKINLGFIITIIYYNARALLNIDLGNLTSFIGKISQKFQSIGRAYTSEIAIGQI